MSNLKDPTISYFDIYYANHSSRPFAPGKTWPRGQTHRQEIGPTPSTTRLSSVGIHKHRRFAALKYPGNVRENMKRFLELNCVISEGHTRNHVHRETFTLLALHRVRHCTCYMYVSPRTLPSTPVRALPPDMGHGA